MKAIEQYFPVVLFIILDKVVLIFKPVDQILRCGHSNESSLAVLLFCEMKFVLMNSPKPFFYLDNKATPILAGFFTSVIDLHFIFTFEGNKVSIVAGKLLF